MRVRRQPHQGSARRYSGSRRGMPGSHAGRGLDRRRSSVHVCDGVARGGQRHDPHQPPRHSRSRTRARAHGGARAMPPHPTWSTVDFTTPSLPAADTRYEGSPTRCCTVVVMLYCSAASHTKTPRSPRTPRGVRPAPPPSPHPLPCHPATTILFFHDATFSHSPGWPLRQERSTDRGSVWPALPNRRPRPTFHR